MLSIAGAAVRLGLPGAIRTAKLVLITEYYEPKLSFYLKFYENVLKYNHTELRTTNRSHCRYNAPESNTPEGKMSEVTKRALEQSLKNLLLKKPLTKITINDIAEDCGINRMTFYYHFKDIYDLVEWSCLEDARKALEEKKTHDTWQEGFLNIFEAVLANKPFIMNVYRCVDREQVEKYLKPLTDGLLMGVIDEQSKGITVRDEDKEFIARIYSYVFIGIMLDWIKGDMKEDPRLIIDKLALLIKDSVSDALNRFKL